MTPEKRITVNQLYNDHLCDIDCLIEKADKLLQITQEQYFEYSDETASHCLIRFEFRNGEDQTWSFREFYWQVQTLLDAARDATFSARNKMMSVMELDLRQIGA